MQATNLRKGMVVLFNGDLCKVLEYHHHTPGNLRAMVQVKLRNLRTGNQFEHRFRSQDEVEQAYINQLEMEYLYSDGHAHHFMNTENYEQMQMTREQLGETVYYLIPNTLVKVEFFEGKPIGLDLPDTMNLKVLQTEPTLQKATASAVMKPATLETGLVLQVPPFVNSGDKVKVDTSEARYVQRVE